MNVEDPYVRHLRRLKWAVLGLTALALAAIEAFYHFARGMPLIEDLLDWLIGMVVASVLIVIAFQIVARHQSRLQREITERTRAEEALRQAEEKYRSIFENAVEGIFQTTIEGQYLTANPALARIYGYESPEELTATVTDLNRQFYVQPDRRAEFIRLIQEHDAVWGFESQVYCRDGRVIWISENARAIRDASGRLVGFEGTTIDITERKRTEEELRDKIAALQTLVEIERVITEDIGLKETLDRILSSARKILPVSECSVTLLDESSGDLVVEASTDGEIGLRISPAAPSAVGWVVKTKQILAEEDAPTNPIFDQQLVQRYGIKSALVVPIIYEDRAIGALGFADYHGQRVFSNDERMMAQAFAHQAAIAIENARLFEQVCAGRERLQALSRRLVEVQENERRRIARELHDEIGQLLTGLQLTLEMSARLPADAVRDSLPEARALVRELIGRVRELSLDLRPAMLDDLGLLPTLLWYFERYTARTDVRVTFKHNRLEGRRFEPEVETAAYRIVQEALTNVARHAGVSEVTVRVWGNREILGVQIEDQGTGFDPEATLAAAGAIGLLGMRERALLLGGLLIIDSTPGAGTCLTAELPLSGRLERREGDRPG